MPLVFLTLMIAIYYSNYDAKYARERPAILKWIILLQK